MESFDDQAEARAALDAITDAETATYLPGEAVKPVRLPIAQVIAVSVLCIVVIAGLLWLQSRESVWGSPASLAVAGLFVAGVMRIEQRHTNVRQKFIMPRHVWWKVMRETWPIGLGVSLMTPGVIWVVDSGQSFRVMLAYAVLYLAVALAITLLAYHFRGKSGAAETS